MPLPFSIILAKDDVAMAIVRDKVVTVESLSTLHEYNKNTYTTKSDPVISGTMTFDGDAFFSGNVDTGSLAISDVVKLVYEDGVFKIAFFGVTTSETSGIKLLSSEGFILKDSNGLYLTAEEVE